MHEDDLVLVPLFVSDESPYIIMGRVVGEMPGGVFGITFRTPFDAPMAEDFRLLVEDIVRIDLLGDTLVTVWSHRFRCIENLTWQRMRARLDWVVRGVLRRGMRERHRRLLAQKVISRRVLYLLYRPGGPGYRRCARRWLDRLA
jgi:hypothetical protein